MKKLRVNLKERSYNVLIKTDALKNASKFIIKNCRVPKNGVIISNRKVFNIYGYVLEELNKNGFNLKVILVPDGEHAKTLKQAEKIYHTLLKYKLNRKSLIVALGGGVVGDLAGYVAATYLRGIPFIQIPTTLLSQVDSSVGGKVAINLKEGKNLIGSFYQPKFVLIDPTCLKTLEKKEFRNGMAEVIKYGFIKDKKFFNYLLKNYKFINALNFKYLEHVIYTSVKNKADVVELDEKEKGLREILNFGHTFGHSIEKTWNFNKYSHGEAVAIGMNMALEFSFKQGFFSNKEFNFVKPIFKRYVLNSKLRTNKWVEVYKNLFYDKKLTDKGLKFILINDIGNVFSTSKILEKDLKNFIKEFCRKL